MVAKWISIAARESSQQHNIVQNGCLGLGKDFKPHLKLKLLGEKKKFLNCLFFGYLKKKKKRKKAQKITDSLINVLESGI